MSSENLQPPRHLSAMTPDMIREAARNPRGLVILSTGAIEQHGPHLPIGVDSILGNYFLNETLKRLDPADPVWVAPPLWIGKSNEHVGFPGTLSLSAASFRNQILTTVRQIKSFGFRRLALLNTHGGNLPVLRTTVREIHLSTKVKTRILSTHPDTGLDEREARAGIHAGHYETSLMLAVAPHLVSMEKADCQWMDERYPAGTLAPEESPATFAWKVSDLSPTGTLGDARKGNASLGQKWAEKVVTGILLQVRDQADGG